MSPEFLRIKCPACGAVLQVLNQPDIESKSATCTVCKTRNLIKNYKKVVAQQEEHTEYPHGGGSEERTRYQTNYEDSVTETGKGLNVIIGQLRVLPNGPSFQLQVGRWIIGRKTVNPPHADFGIPTDNKRMSRQHLVIEVKKILGKGYVHYASLFKAEVNATFIGQSKMAFGDCVVLRHGDIIQLPDKQLRFYLPDDEGTTT